ncbi:MAG: DoxX family membrane protein [Planctomycetota bacterium]|jgi:uncharacterized membrane protein YphA (DoxX/SURF4 family)
MKIAIIVARILLGLPFLVFGLNGFLEFLEDPELSVRGQAFVDAMHQTGYMLSLLHITEVVCGALLIAGIFVPLALTVLAPVLINILLFHIKLDTNGIEIAIGLCVLEAFLVFAHAPYFDGVMKLKAKPFTKPQP